MHHQQQQQQQQQRMKHNAGSWFQGSPLSHFLVYLALGTHFLLEHGGFSGGTELINLNLDDIFTHGEVHRLFLNQCTFGNMGEMVVGLMTLGKLMISFEREFGTRKFASFLLIKCFLLSTLLQLFSLMVLDGLGFGVTHLAPGPYSYIGSLLCLYHFFTPRLYTKFIGILGMDFSEKAMTYVFTIMTVCSQGLSSLIPSICGFIAAGISINTSQRNPYGKWECTLPNFVIRFGANVGKVLGFDQSITNSAFINRGSGLSVTGLGAGGIRQQGRTGTAHTNRRNGAAGAAHPATSAVAAAMQQQQQPQFQPPTQEAIDQLTAMGFEREAVVRALGQTDNNVEAAANRLLSGI